MNFKKMSLNIYALLFSNHPCGFPTEVGNLFQILVSNYFTLKSTEVINISKFIYILMFSKHYCGSERDTAQFETTLQVSST